MAFRVVVHERHGLCRENLEVTLFVRSCTEVIDTGCGGSRRYRYWRCVARHLWCPTPKPLTSAMRQTSAAEGCQDESQVL
ncbi:hypothetical protein Q1695_010059 [Nippostrongylus brasiliensis]|nr:hypothetical protein Q1695_010059 [Nippostrongylus brasiliensis]